MSKDIIYFRRKPLEDCDPSYLSACIKHCWKDISGKHRRWAKRKLFKIANNLARKTLKYREANEQR